MEIGIDSFAARFDEAGLAVSSVDRIRELLERIEQADQVGLDVFGVGEHHKREFLDSAPPVILAAAASRTQRIRLTSAVTVLSAADPVRLFQRFAMFKDPQYLAWRSAVLDRDGYICQECGKQCRKYSPQVAIR